MAVLRLFGHHVKQPGKPSFFRTKRGFLFSTAHHGAASTTPVFSRKEETTNLDAVRAQHSEAIAQFDSSKHNTLHVTNNSEYIHRLNEGWSAQTPAGFFERSVREAQGAIRGWWRIRST